MKQLIVTALLASAAIGATNKWSYCASTTSCGCSDATKTFAHVGDWPTADTETDPETCSQTFPETTVVGRGHCLDNGDLEVRWYDDAAACQSNTGASTADTIPLGNCATSTYWNTQSVAQTVSIQNLCVKAPAECTAVTGGTCINVAIDQCSVATGKDTKATCNKDGSLTITRYDSDDLTCTGTTTTDTIPHAGGARHPVANGQFIENNCPVLWTSYPDGCTQTGVDAQVGRCDNGVSTTCRTDGTMRFAACSGSGTTFSISARNSVCGAIPEKALTGAPANLPTNVLNRCPVTFTDTAASAQLVTAKCNNDRVGTCSNGQLTVKKSIATPVTCTGAEEFSVTLNVGETAFGFSNTCPLPQVGVCTVNQCFTETTDCTFGPVGSCVAQNYKGTCNADGSLSLQYHSVNGCGGVATPLESIPAGGCVTRRNGAVSIKNTCPGSTATAGGSSNVMGWFTSASATTNVAAAGAAVLATLVALL